MPRTPSSTPANFAAQTSLPKPRRLHVALIPDGNGRWAVARGHPRSAGHRAGVRSVRTAVRAAPALGIGTLTIHAISSDNWKRPEAEVRAILACIAEFLEAEREHCVAEGVRVTVIGRRDRLPADVLDAITETERATAGGERLHLRLAVDYSSRATVASAAAIGSTAALAGNLAAETITRLLGSDGPRGARVGDVDLVVRTGGEMRLSDFLLWECAYAEILFTTVPWPDFGAAHLGAALAEFGRRERRFGGLPEPASPPPTVAKRRRAPAVAAAAQAVRS